jgi:hypothetical protein
MARLVQKFGGTSVGDPQRIRAVAERVKRAYDSGDELPIGCVNRLLLLTVLRTCRNTMPLLRRASR